MIRGSWTPDEVENWKSTIEGGTGPDGGDEEMSPAGRRIAKEGLSRAERIHQRFCWLLNKRKQGTSFDGDISGYPAVLAGLSEPKRLLVNRASAANEHVRFEAPTPHCI